MVQTMVVVEEMVIGGTIMGEREREAMTIEDTMVEGDKKTGVEGDKKTGVEVMITMEMVVVAEAMEVEVEVATEIAAMAVGMLMAIVAARTNTGIVVHMVLGIEIGHDQGMIEEDGEAGVEAVVVEEVEEEVRIDKHAIFIKSCFAVLNIDLSFVYSFVKQISQDLGLKPCVSK